ncbi:MAG: hypothetical protein RI883_1663 [Bacteroidota bacterium]|jgi:hypothetical protein
MTKNYILSFSAIVILGAVSFQKSGDFKVEKYFAKNGHLKSGSGQLSARTGAPGEANCSSCHGPTISNLPNDVTENNLMLLSGVTPVTSYVPGTTYSVALNMTSNPAKKGFQATVLTSTNVMAGTFTGVTGNTSVFTASARDYANHTATSNTNTTTLWGWSWTAPATNVGDVTFYVATNKTNNSNTDAGDVIYLSQHVFSSTLGLVEQTENQSNFTVGYSPENNNAVFNFTTLSVGEMVLNLVDLNGRSVFRSDLGTAQIGQNNQSVALPSDLKNGIYIANFFVNNKVMSAKIMIQK